MFYSHLGLGFTYTYSDKKKNQSYKEEYYVKNNNYYITSFLCNKINENIFLWLDFCIKLINHLRFSGLDKKQREVAMIAEMIHSASLIHDDVIDQSDFRRGKPSVNALWSHKKVRKQYNFVNSNIGCRYVSRYL